MMMAVLRIGKITKSCVVSANYWYLTAFYDALNGRMFQWVNVSDFPDSGKNIAKNMGIPGPGNLKVNH